MRSISSLITTEILKFRNPLASEEHWIGRPESYEPSQRSIVQRVATSAALCLVSVASLAESSAYLSFAMLTTPLKRYAETPHQVFKDLFFSSAFVPIWSTTAICADIGNVSHIMTHEHTVKYAIAALICHLGYGTREELMTSTLEQRGAYISQQRSDTMWLEDHIANNTAFWDHTITELEKGSHPIPPWIITCMRAFIDKVLLGEGDESTESIESDHDTESIESDDDTESIESDDNVDQEMLEERHIPQSLVDLGAEFLLTDILANTSEKNIDLFKEVDGEIIQKVLNKSVYLYVFGKYKEQTVPDFFKEESIEQIRSLRESSHVLHQEDLEHIDALFHTLDHTIKPLLSQEAACVTKKLESIASGELQNGILITNCWHEANQLLEEK